MNVPWITLAGLVPFLFSGIFHSCIEERAIQKLQRSPKWISLSSDPVWHRLARTLFEELKKNQELTLRYLMNERADLGVQSEVPKPGEAETVAVGTYGKLPEVHVDMGHGAIFPAPVSSPNRFSWFQLCVSEFQTSVRIAYLNRALQNKKVDRATRIKRFDHLVSHWNGINQDYVGIIQKLRYLESWIPQLKRHYLSHAGGSPASQTLLNAIFKGDARLTSALQEIMRPHRSVHRDFLPDDLKTLRKSRTLKIPVTTDIDNPQFIREVEDAIQVHWNQSPWAKSERIQFSVQWTKIPENPEFARGLETLAQHLARFPKSAAAMTTGGLTTHVKESILVFGQGKITPRTIAHEFGHLLGFPDCYLRTLSDQNLFGLGVLEWDNPIYPDDIMCDNSVGVARAESW